MTERNYGLDIARCAAMCGIITLHFLGAGGVLIGPEIGSVKYWGVWLIEIIAYCSVDLFALLSGYLGINSKKKSVYRVIELVVVVVFYCLLITVVCRMLNIGNYSSWKRYVVYVFPYLFGRYWYIVCYIPLGIIQPYINKMLLSLTEKQHAIVCYVAVLFLGLLPVAFRNEMFAINRGYSFVWLVVCYAIGALLKRRESRYDRALPLTGILVGCAIVLLMGNVFLYWVRGHFYQYFIEYNSPFILLMSISMLLLFKKLQVKKMKNITVLLSGLAFDVYIIHCHILIFDYVIRDRFVGVVPFSIPIIWGIIVGSAILAFCILSVIGYGRMFVFEKCKINNLMRWVANRIDPILYKDF